VLPTNGALPIYGPEKGQGLANSLAFGDFDGDELADLLIGAPFIEGPPRDDDRRKGRVYVIYGATLQQATGPLDLRYDYDLVIYGDREDHELGYSVASSRFLGGDPGRAEDIAAGSWLGYGFIDDRRSRAGEIYVFFSQEEAPPTAFPADLNGDGLLDYKDVFLFSLTGEDSASKISEDSINQALDLIGEWRQR